MADRVIGLDIGASSVKAAQVLRGKDGTFVVEKQAAKPLPRGAVYDGRIAETERERVSQAIAALVAEADFDTRDVIYGLNSSSAVFMEELIVPVMSPEDVEKAMPALIEAEHPHLSPVDNQFSFTVVGEAVGEQGERLLRVLVFSCLAAYTKEIADVVIGAGLNIVGADLNALAALRAIELHDRPAGLVDAVIDIGSSLSVLLIHHNGVPKVLSLDPDSAGDVATVRIADAIGVDEEREWAKAEWHKMNDDNPVGLIAQARADYTKTLASKLVTSLSSFLNHSPEFDGLANLSLVGGGSLLHGLGFQLREALGEVPLEYARLSEVITGVGGVPVERHENRSGGDYLVAIGLGTGTRI